MGLRVATPDDAFACSVMMRNFIQNSEYATLYDANYARSFAETHLGRSDGVTIISERDGTATGMVAAVSGPHPFVPITVATELCWWVEPHARNSRQGLELLKAYEYWAVNIKKAKLVCLASLNNERVDRIYQRMGYSKTEHAWTKRID